jgi:hypothetical protein
MIEVMIPPMQHFMSTKTIFEVFVSIISVT